MPPHWTPGTVTSVSPSQVLLFGSNASGFHGAGSAGFAMRGDTRNTWRDDPAFRRAMHAPPGHPDRTGLYAVYGVARGHQTGTRGMSYAIQTIERPGARRSTSRREIYAQLTAFAAFSLAHPHWEMLVTPIGEGYSGWTREEMHEVWCWLERQKGFPPNWTFLRPPNARDIAAST